jgi:hypothetical protein
MKRTQEQTRVVADGVEHVIVSAAGHAMRLGCVIKSGRIKCAKNAERECDDMKWIKSTLCVGGDCTEVAFTGTEVLLRDSKTTATIAVSRVAWQAFLDGLRSGAFEQGPS